MSDNKNQKNNSKDFLIGTLVGGIIGGVTAFLLAPKSGKELRDDISEQSVQLRNKGVEITSIAQERASSIVKTVSEQSNQVVGKVKKLASNIRSDSTNLRMKGEEVKEEAEETYNEITESIEDEVSQGEKNEQGKKSMNSSSHL